MGNSVKVVSAETKTIEAAVRAAMLFFSALLYNFFSPCDAGLHKRFDLRFFH